VELTKRQVETIRFIRRFVDENGFSPTVREIQAAVGHASASSTHNTLTSLRDLNVIDWNRSSPRTIRLKV
jgi:repressor LexA